MTAKENAKQELQTVFDLFQKNINFVGSRKSLKEQYPKGYARLIHEISEKAKVFLLSYFKNIYIQDDYISVVVETLNYYKKNELKKAINDFDADQVEEVFDKIFFFVVNNGDNHIRYLNM